MPRKFSFRERQLFEAIQGKIIPWVQDGAPLILLDPPPFAATREKAQINIREVAATPLPALHGMGGDVRVRYWKDENLNAYNVPYWGCVMEGEADLVVGATKEMCQERNLKPARWTVSMPAKTLFWMPPGVPVTMTGGHWERPHPEKSRSRIFWMYVTPTGAHCHFCTTHDGRHWEHPFLFVPTPHLWPIAQRISKEFEGRSVFFQSMLEYSMQILLLHTLRGIHEQEEVSPAIDDISQSIGNGSGEQIITRALHYIDERFHSANLTLAEVARHVHVSPTHLGRLFRKHLQSTVWQVIVNKRFERACQFLEESTFNVRQISIYCGYSHTSTFVAAFAKRYGMSPSEFRQKHAGRNVGES